RLSHLAACSFALAAAPSVAEGLSAKEKAIVAQVEAHKEAAVDLLRRAVDVPSATENHEGVKRVGEIFAAELRALGFEARWVDVPPEVHRAGHLVAERAGKTGKRLLLIGHLDTVLQGEGFRREGGRAYGSGASDMKGGDVVMIEALRALEREGALRDRRIAVVMTGDEEETGKPHSLSRAALFDLAKRSDVALAFEGYAPGAAVVGRRGFGSFRLEVTGSQGHSSGIFGESRGDGAIFAAARILTAFHDELREPYLTYNPSVVVGGSDAALDASTASGTATGKHNVVPKTVIVEGDTRFLSRGQLERAREKMKAIVSKNLPKTSATIAFLDGMPSMAPTEGNRKLLSLLDGVSRDLGTGPIAEHDPLKRGAGDISFVAETLDGLDGLGALGENEHAPGEYVELEEQPKLAERAALLIYRLTR
ncbi:MAG TPA: M20/M25/M40 family metallo-hydrolase, partial [Thermoanaerobaculia bacterium]|nr:M20/M25/M40 family metallo-hydrolase [Thermoanaerobaculia bacterium]